MAIQAGTTLTNFEMNLVHGGSNCKVWVYGEVSALGVVAASCFLCFCLGGIETDSLKYVTRVLGGVSLLAVTVATGFFIKSFFCSEALDKSGN